MGDRQVRRQLDQSASLDVHPGIKLKAVLKLIVLSKDSKDLENPVELPLRVH